MIDPLDFATDLALNTGNLLKDYFNPAGTHAIQKNDQTVVTKADLAADKFITEAILNTFPEDRIISEESSHQIDETHSPVWIIDPLDGTTNFSLGLSIWGVSIARITNGYPDIGVTFFPMINELYSTKRGAGSFLNQTRIISHAPDHAQSMSFFACCSRSFRNYDISIPYKPRILGSSAYSFCMLARGSALLSFDAAAKIWDLAAAWLLVEEAGGVIAAFEGPPPFPISSNKNYSDNFYPTLAAATANIFSFGQRKIIRKPKFTPEFQVDY